MRNGLSLFFAILTCGADWQKNGGVNVFIAP